VSGLTLSNVKKINVVTSAITGQAVEIKRGNFAFAPITAIEEITMQRRPLEGR
jgi:hypothetical protein